MDKEIQAKLNSVKEKATPRSIAKMVVNVVVYHCVSKVVVSAINNNVEPNNKRENAQTIVGSHVLGAVVATSAKPWVSEQVDDVFDFVAEVRSKTKSKLNDSEPKNNPTP